MTERYLRLRGASRMAASFGVMFWITYLIMAANNPTQSFTIALKDLLPTIGGALVVGALVFGAAASYVMNEKLGSAAASLGISPAETIANE